MSAATQLSGRTCLLTGASGGIGRALSAHLARAGVDLALSYRSHRDDAERAAELARGQGVRAVVLQADLADASAPARLVDDAERELGRIDLLVANAGHARPASYAELDVEGWDTTVTVNLRAPVLLAQRVLPGMVGRGFGRVLFVSSVAGFTGGVVGPDYAASKAGLHGLTHHLAARVAAHGVTVNAIAPALVEDTRMLPGDGGAPPVPIPVGRLGRPDEVAELATAMLRVGYLTSKVVGIDGGLYPR